MIAANIKWDTDGDKELLNQLPQSVEILEGMADVDASAPDMEEAEELGREDAI